MNEAQFKELVAKVGEEAAKTIKDEIEKRMKALDEKIADAVKNKATKEELMGLVKTAVEEANVATKEAYEKILKEQGTAIGELKAQVKEANTASKKLTFSEAVHKAFADMPEETKKAWDHMIETGKQKQPFYITIDKVAIDMGESNTIGSGSTQVTLTENTGIISPIRQRIEKYLSKVSTGSISTKYALWIEETDQQGTPIAIAEGVAKTKLSSKWVEKTKPVRKIPVIGKVTTELLNDLPQLVSYIKNSLSKRLSVAIEDQLISGDDTGENLKGAEEWATAFSAGALAGLVTAPNEFDVLTAIALQVKVANGVANGVFINPVTWAIMQTLKDENNRPLWKDYVTPAGTVVFAGMEIIESNGVEAGDFIGGDLSVLNVLFREQMSIQIGLDGTDFSENKKTILIETRLVQFVSANDAPCLVKGTFEDAKTALGPGTP